MDSTLDILKRLNDSGVEFVVVGGLAGVAHGSAMVTEDVDVCAPLNRKNLSRILTALGAVNPRFRTTPNRPPLPNDPSCLVGYKNLYLVTDLGQIDFLSEITGIGDFGQVSNHTIGMDLAGVPCQVLDLDALIRSKTALGRAKDLRAAMELEALRQRLGNGQG